MLPGAGVTTSAMLSPHSGTKRPFLAELHVGNEERDGEQRHCADEAQALPEAGRRLEAHDHEPADEHDRQAHDPDREVVERAERDGHVQRTEQDRVAVAPFLEPLEREQEAEGELADEHQLRVAEVVQRVPAERERDRREDRGVSARGEPACE